MKGSVLTTSSGSDARRTGLRLGLLLGLVVLIQLVYLHQFPFPPHSSHDGFTLVPQLQRLVMGQIPDDARFGMFEGTGKEGRLICRSVFPAGRNDQIGIARFGIAKLDGHRRRTPVSDRLHDQFRDLRATLVRDETGGNLGESLAGNNSLLTLTLVAATYTVEFQGRPEAECLER